MRHPFQVKAPNVYVTHKDGLHGIPHSSSRSKYVALTVTENYEKCIFPKFGASETIGDDRNVMIENLILCQLFFERLIGSHIRNSLQQWHTGPTRIE